VVTLEEASHEAEDEITRLQAALRDQRDENSRNLALFLDLKEAKAKEDRERANRRVSKKYNKEPCCW